MASGSSSESSDSSDEELEMLSMIIQAAAAVTSTSHFFGGNELDDQKQECVDKNIGVRDYLATVQATPYLFRTLTNFTASEFEEFCQLVCPVIASSARSTGQVSSNAGRPSKLSPQQRLMSFVIYMKHDNISTFDAALWNWARSSMCDDSIFIASCINQAAADEIRWPSSAERQQLSAVLPQFPGCIGFIDGTLVKIRRPFRDTQHRSWFNGRKKMYCFNNTVIIDHNGLFTFVDPGYPGKWHDVNILRCSEIFQNWRQHFTHSDDYWEYLIGDPGYLGEEMFIMRRIGGREIPEGADMNPISLYNKVHAGYRVRVEWGIGGLKQKWRRLMKRFDNTKPKFPHLFRAACIMTNFLHRRRMDLHSENIGEQRTNVEEFGWDGDY